MNIEFSKYQGTGNDVVLLNNMNGRYNDLTLIQIAFLCDRKLGIGADGLIKLSKKEGVDFEVEYFNADGTQSFCGNGARCSVAFAKEIGLIASEAFFLAIDGEHKASIKSGIVRLEMLPVSEVLEMDGDYIVDTGSPHYINMNSKGLDIITYGQSIRYSDTFSENGINVNLVDVIDENTIQVQTYERGVEDETLSCGTGVTACALVFMKDEKEKVKVNVETKGGILSVEADPFSNEFGFANIWLSGPAIKVFDGSIDV